MTMGREVRRVPYDWQHPKNEFDRYKPLFPGERYEANATGFMEKANAEGLQEAIDWYGQAPDQNDYMPNWPESERTHYMMYEDTSEGTPISPAFATPEELARWLADTGASSFGSNTASYEGWLRVAKGGWAPSAVSIGGGPLVSGVDAL
jgi:hypothetical protein